MVDFPILSFLIFSPVIGALFVLLSASSNAEQAAQNARLVAFWSSLVTFGASLWLWAGFDGASAAFQFVEYKAWFNGYDIGYHLGVDGISLFFVVLTALLMPICILASWYSVKERVREYLVAFLLLEATVIGVFCALDFLLFYVFFEAVLIPMYLIIGIWGGKNRVYAAFKFFLYTLLGSVLLLVALVYAYAETGTTSIPELMQLLPHFSLEVQQWLWLALFASFAVKVPMWPVHTWLPDAHVQAPTAGSVILAGILLKMGGYGYLRFSLPMLPDASIYFAEFVFWLSVIAVIYTSLVALVQEDMKKLIAYSSVAHMGIVTIGLFSFNQQGIDGAIMQMISHGLVSGALFLCVGVVYDRMHTRQISAYGGVVKVMPSYALLFLFFTMASIGLPGTSGFVGELLVIIGAYQVSSWLAAGAATGMILGAGYALWLYRRVVFGEIVNDGVKKMKDLRWNEWATLTPLAVLTLWLGIYPNIILQPISPAVENLLTQLSFSSELVPEPVALEALPLPDVAAELSAEDTPEIEEPTLDGEGEQ